jgi:steroid delta-isomerase-like uncharacterized protein
MEENNLTIPEMVDNVRSGNMSRRQLMKLLTTMGVSAAGVGVVVAAIGPATNSAPQAAYQETENPETHLRLHDSHLSYQTSGNTDALHQDYAEHAILDDSLYSAPLTGRSEIMERKHLGLAAATNPKINVVNRIASGNQVTVEWIASGLHTGDLPGLPASNRTYVLRGVTVVVRENGKIVRESLYYDKSDLYRQLSQ